MDMTMRAATPAERLYTAQQSMQIEGQTGCIGHLRADMGADGNGFFRTWKDHRQYLATEEFQTEFESVLNALVGDEQYGGFLKSRDAMDGFCRERPESGFNDGFAFGFRADTAQYSYLIRLQPYILTDKCNLHCRHCSVNNITSAIYPYRQIRDEIRLLYQMSARILFFCGGETFLWEDSGKTLRDLVIEAKQMGFLIVNVVTNGTFPLTRLKRAQMERLFSEQPLHFSFGAPAPRKPTRPVFTLGISCYSQHGYYSCPMRK